MDQFVGLDEFVNRNQEVAQMAIARVAAGIDAQGQAPRRPQRLQPRIPGRAPPPPRVRVPVAPVNLERLELEERIQWATENHFMPYSVTSHNIVDRKVTKADVFLCCRDSGIRIRTEDLYLAHTHPQTKYVKNENVSVLLFFVAGHSLTQITQTIHSQDHINRSFLRDTAIHDRNFHRYNFVFEGHPDPREAAVMSMVHMIGRIAVSHGGVLCAVRPDAVVCEINGVEVVFNPTSIFHRSNLTQLKVAINRLTNHGQHLAKNVGLEHGLLRADWL